MDETHENPPTPPPDETQPSDGPPAPRPPRPAFLDAPTETAAVVPPKTGWWASIDRASRIALGIAAGLLVIALAIGAFGLSRMSHTSTNITATRRLRSGGGSGFGGGPMGGRGMMRDFRTQGIATAAGAIGISESDLQSQIASGKSIADVAKAHNVDPQKVIDAIVAAESKQIDDGVKSGNIPQAFATRIEASLEQSVAARVYATGGRGPGMMGGDVPPNGSQ